jgi:trimethylamine--corrinoid protein Co-methyltransferase
MTLASLFNFDGSPARSLCIQTGAALANAYGFPHRSGGCDTDGYLIDARCGSESMMATCLSDTHLVIHSAGVMGSYGAVSPEKMVFDMATIQQIRSLQNGIDMSDEHLALAIDGYRRHFPIRRIKEELGEK